MSLPLIMRFSLTNEDRLIAYNAQLNNVCKPALRYSLIALGFLAILGPPALLLSHMKTRLNLLDLAFFITGAILVRAWIIAPVIMRHRIRKENGAAKMIKVIIDENTITEETGDTPKDIREWAEIDKIVETSKGMLIYHNNRSLFWLPIRAFENTVALDEFLNLAGRKDKL